MSQLTVSSALLFLSLATAASAAPKSVAPAVSGGTYALIPNPLPTRQGAVERIGLQAGERVGLYPFALPDGQRAFADQLTAQLRDGAAGLPNLQSLKALAHGACLTDESTCLAAAARNDALTEMVAGRVLATPKGFAFELHLFAADDGRELSVQRGTIEGGPLDLAGGLEHGLCKLLGGAPCEGSLLVAGAGVVGTHLVVDGRDLGTVPLSAPVSLPVGRHLVRAGNDERRIRIAYGRETRIVCAAKTGEVALLDGDGAPSALSGEAPADAVAAVPASTAETSVRTRAARLVLAAGGALLMTAGGVELYARVQGAVLDNRYQRGQLTSADAASYGRVHSAGVAALIVGATGLGALAVGGTLFLLSPDGASIQGKF